MIYVINNILLITVLPELVLALILRRRNQRAAEPGWHVKSSVKTMTMLTLCVLFFWGIGAIVTLAELTGHMRKGDLVIYKLPVLLAANLIGLLVIGEAHWSIQYDENGFLYCSRLLQKKRFSYGDFTGIRGVNTVDLFCGKTKIRIRRKAGETEPGENDFLRYAVSKYQIIHGTDIPPSTGRDSGNEDEPNDRLVSVCVVVGILILGTIVVAVDAVRPVSEEDVSTAKVVFDRCYPEKGNLILWEKGSNRRYKILEYKTCAAETELLMQRCNGRTLFTAAVEQPFIENMGRHRTTHTYLIISLRDSSYVQYVTDEQASEAKMSRLPLVSGLAFSAILLSVAGGFGAMKTNLQLRRFSPEVQGYLAEHGGLQTQGEIPASIEKDQRVRPAEKQESQPDDVPVQRDMFDGVCLLDGGQKMVGVVLEGSKLQMVGCDYLTCSCRTDCEIGKRIAELEGT